MRKTDNRIIEFIGKRVKYLSIYIDRQTDRQIDADVDISVKRRLGK